MWYGLAADLIVAVHFSFVAFIVVGQLAIVIGMLAGWKWIRNPWFRFGHLISILFVALEAMVGVACPLTIWEDNLRQWAGQDVTEGTFIGRCFHSLLFYDLDAAIFNLCYILFAGIVIVTFLVAPPRLTRLRKSEAGKSSDVHPESPNGATHPSSKEIPAR